MRSTQSHLKMKGVTAWGLCVGHIADQGIYGKIGTDPLDSRS